MRAPVALALALQGIALLALHARAAPAGSFLAAPAPGEQQHGEPQLSLLREIEQTLGGDHRRAAEARMGRLEEAMRPMFASLAKNPLGAVGAASARYALHRLFVQLHGWQLKGIDPSGAGWAEASLVKAFGDRVPEQLHELFEEHLGSRGFNLHELALVAAMLEHMFHGEVESHMQSIYKVLRQPTDLPLDEPQAIKVIDAYMASYILGANFSLLTSDMLQYFSHSIVDHHPSWHETRAFLREVQHDVRAGTTSFSFSDVKAVVEEAIDRFGRWQSRECLVLKEQLTAFEDSAGTGRVRLSDFYASALHGGKWQFSESAEYLRQLGAIDDTDPSAPRVIIPNYLYSPSNCVASSRFHAICCIDECEELLGHLERRLERPTATPEEISAFVSALPSASLPANRTLAPGLIGRLNEVAEHHGGRVPLHGRLFAQWMHHAYPRECPYPHVSGTTKPQRPEEWEADAGQTVTASQAEMVLHIEASRDENQRPAVRQNSSDDGMCSPMWTMEEELIDAHILKADPNAAATPGHGTLTSRTVLRTVSLLGAAGSLLLALTRKLARVADRANDKSAWHFQKCSV